ncbi:MAG: MBL fold metallo-hydrolase [Candidatus Solibacter usitatus]|nr:MBL fold metallo-hydrolase [Candidatus Solibacter usitatus]
MRAILFALAVICAPAQTMLKDGQLHVVLCGTGSPLPDPQRASACTAIIANGEFLLFDIGPGSWRKAGLTQLPLANLSAVFLTHFHSDHIGDLGEAITMSWAAGRAQPLDVFGPPGADKVVAGFQAAYSLDAGYRTEHHSAQWMPPAGAKAKATAANSDQPVFDRSGVRVFAFPVNHHPITAAFGYRIEYRGRKVVITGDTSKSKEVEKNAARADLLIHDALSKDMILAAAAMAEGMGQKRQGKMARDIVTYHATPVEAAETAASAKVETLVLTHIVPPLRDEAHQKVFLRGVAEAFAGKIVLAADGMRFDFPPR